MLTPTSVINELNRQIEQLRKTLRATLNYFSKTRRTHLFLFGLILLKSTFIFLFFIKLYLNPDYTRQLNNYPHPPPKPHRDQNFSQNFASEYFPNSSIISKSYIVNTPNCKIPDLDPWDEDHLKIKIDCALEPQHDRSPRCYEKQRFQWAYASGANLVINQSAIRESGYSWENIRCCYYVIQRIEQSFENYNKKLNDRLVRFSDTCYHIKDPVHPMPPKHDFIRLFCRGSRPPLLEDIVYRDYLAFAQPDDRASEKISQWLQNTKNGTKANLRPPNVILIGLDNQSRLNSRRYLPKTLNYLRDLGAVELLGYTKVAENTYPNTAAFLAGMSSNNMHNSVGGKRPENNPQDDYPYIWKDFDKAGYLTSTADDAPLFGGFNFHKVGFIKKPTDFYFRPLTLKVVQSTPRDRWWFVFCTGRWQSDEIMNNYILDIFRVAMGTPIFSHSWVTTFMHECLRGALQIDENVVNFVKGLDLETTIFFLLSDHGLRYGPFRETTLGWYEDKLPTMWVYLPQSVSKRFPEWRENLKLNADRLTSHYDLYQTMVHILESYVPTVDRATKHLDSYRKFGQSLFNPVPVNRSCQDAGIPGSYCPCSEPEVIQGKVEESMVKEAAKSVVHFIEMSLPLEKCVKPKLGKIMSGKRMKNNQDDGENFLVTFYTEPGQFLFEATVKMRLNRDTGANDYEIKSFDEILRMNKMERNADCVDNAILQRYCYCL